MTRNVVARLFYPAGSVRRVLVGTIRGAKFKVRPESSMGLTFALGVDAFHQRWFARQVRRGMTVWDVGANRGQMTLHFARWVGPEGKVVSFEPHPPLFSDLLYNIELNGITNVEAHCVAVGKEPGRAEFGFDETAQTAGKLIDCEATNNNSRRKTTLVETLSLDAFHREGSPPPDIVKVDVEGGAGLVLQGATAVLERFSPAIFIEQHGPEEQSAIKRYLLDRGYRAQTLAGEPVSDPTVAFHNPLWCRRSAQT